MVLPFPALRGISLAPGESIQYSAGPSPLAFAPGQYAWPVAPDGLLPTTGWEALGYDGECGRWVWGRRLVDDHDARAAREEAARAAEREAARLAAAAHAERRRALLTAWCVGINLDGVLDDAWRGSAKFSKATMLASEARALPGEPASKGTLAERWTRLWNLADQLAGAP